MEPHAQMTLAPLGGHDPGPLLPRRIVTNVLGMSALEIGDPVRLGVLVKADDLAVDAGRVRQAQALSPASGVARNTQRGAEAVFCRRSRLSCAA